MKAPTAHPIRTAHLIGDAIRQVARHPRQLVQITGLIWLLQLPAYLSGPEYLPLEGLRLLGVPFSLMTLIISVLMVPAAYLGLAWAAVGWHRLNLIDEQPGLIAPQPRLRIVLIYVVVALILHVLVWLLPQSLLANGPIYLLINPTAINVLIVAVTSLIAVFIGSFLILRLSPIMVGAALERRIGVADAFAMTAPITKQITAISLIAAVVITVGHPALLRISMALGGAYLREPRQQILFAEGIAYWVIGYLLFIACISTYTAVFRAVSPKASAESAVS